MRTYEQISDILCAIPDEWFDKLGYWFDEWCSGSAPKLASTTGSARSVSPRTNTGCGLRCKKHRRSQKTS